MKGQGKGSAIAVKRRSKAVERTAEGSDTCWRRTSSSTPFIGGASPVSREVTCKSDGRSRKGSGNS